MGRRGNKGFDWGHLGSATLDIGRSVAGLSENLDAMSEREQAQRTPDNSACAVGEILVVVIYFL